MFFSLSISLFPFLSYKKKMIKIKNAYIWSIYRRIFSMRMKPVFVMMGGRKVRAWPIFRFWIIIWIILFIIRRKRRITWIFHLIRALKARSCARALTRSLSIRWWGSWIRRKIIRSKEENKNEKYQIQFYKIYQIITCKVAGKKKGFNLLFRSHPKCFASWRKKDEKKWNNFNVNVN